MPERFPDGALPTVEGAGVMSLGSILKPSTLSEPGWGVRGAAVGVVGGGEGGLGGGVTREILPDLPPLVSLSCVVACKGGPHTPHPSRIGALFFILYLTANWCWMQANT